MPAKIDLTNTQHEYFIIQSPAPNRGKNTYWNCICKRCGNKCIISTQSLRRGTTKSCGCLHRDMLIKKNKQNYVNLTGQRFGNLVCIKKAGSLREHAAWLCKCDCGNEIITDSGSLRAGYRTSCGCRRVSGPAKKIETILIQNNINYKKEVTFPDLRSPNNHSLYFDFVIYNKNNEILKIIEYDGEQHFSSKGDNIFFSDDLKTRQINDNIKNNWCKQNNIFLLRISYLNKNKISYDFLFNQKERCLL